MTNIPTTVEGIRGRGWRAVPSYVLWMAALSGLGLSIAYLFNICSACSVTGQYRVFGLNFGWFGVAFFTLLLVLIGLRRRLAGAGALAAMLLFVSAGAESRFIWIQKYEIGQWCPVCLAIAVAVACGCIAASLELVDDYRFKGVLMKSRFSCLLVASLLFALGLGAAVLGVHKEAEAAGMDLFLGKTSSKTTVYFVSDWFCPACKKVEPAIEKMYPDVARVARVSFVDFPIHKETLNFTPYNLQFLTFEKDKYIGLRKALSELALKTKNPGEAEVQAAINPLGVKLRQMNYADTLTGMQANLMVYRGFDLKSTPSVVITHAKSKKTKILVGENQISKQAVLAAIQEVER